jgi:hypothetical protein
MSNWGEGFAEGDSGVPAPGHAVRVWNDTQAASAKKPAEMKLGLRDPAEICAVLLGQSMAIADNQDNPVEARNMALANGLDMLKYAVKLAAGRADCA